MTTTQKEEYDLIISLGRECSCTNLLRAADMQERSYPFDWLTSSSFSFDTRILLLVNGFKDFFRKEDFSMIENHTFSETNCNSYKNNKTGLYFRHDFLSTLCFDDAFDEVKEKYERRIKRLYDKIDESRKVLFVWFDQGFIPTDQQLLDAYMLLSRKFSKQEISFLIIGNNPEAETLEEKRYTIKKDKLVTFATKYTYNMRSDRDSEDGLHRSYGDPHFLGTIFNEYGLRSKQ
jgi:hypothetical protein